MAGRSPGPAAPAPSGSGAPSPAPDGTGGAGAPRPPSGRAGGELVEPAPDSIDESDGSGEWSRSADREPAGAPAPDPERPRPIDEAVLEQARQSIRPTRRGPRGEQTDDDRDAAAERDDETLDESDESHTELLARQLGAQIIAEEEHGT